MHSTALLVEIALVELKMPGINGEETLKALKKEHPWMEIVILTGHGSIDSAAECTRGGAHSYLLKPCDLEQLLKALMQAYKIKDLMVPLSDYATVSEIE